MDNVLLSLLVAAAFAKSSEKYRELERTDPPAAVAAAFAKCEQGIKWTDGHKPFETEESCIAAMEKKIQGNPRVRVKCEKAYFGGQMVTDVVVSTFSTRSDGKLLNLDLYFPSFEICKEATSKPFKYPGMVIDKDDFGQPTENDFISPPGGPLPHVDKTCITRKETICSQGENGSKEIHFYR